MVRVHQDPNISMSSVEVNKYFVVKDSPNIGVEILEHRLSTNQDVEEVRHWHVEDRISGCYAGFFFSADLMPCQ